MIKTKTNQSFAIYHDLNINASLTKVFDNATFTINDDRFDYGKKIYITLGMLEEIVVVIAHLEEDELIRIISMRKATKNEQKIYFKGFSY